MIQLEQKFKDQAVKSQDKSVRADIINDLQLLQSGFQYIQFGLFYRIFRLIVPDEHELLNIRDIFFYKIQWDLKNDSLVGDYTFGGMDHIGVNQNAVTGINGEAGRIRMKWNLFSGFWNVLQKDTETEKDFWESSH